MLQWNLEVTSQKQKYRQTDSAHKPALNLDLKHELTAEKKEREKNKKKTGYVGRKIWMILVK